MVVSAFTLMIKPHIINFTLLLEDSLSSAIIDPNLGGHGDGDGDNDDLNLAWYGAREVVVPRVTAAGPRKTYLDDLDLKFLSLGQVGSKE